MSHPQELTGSKKVLVNIAAFFIFIAIVASVLGVVYLAKEYFLVNLAVIGLIWFGFFAFEYAINGGSFWRCFKEDFKLFGINGLKHRINFVKKEFKNLPNLTICGNKKSWSMKDGGFTEQEYLDCANDVLGKGYYFWISKFVVPLGIVLFAAQRHFLIF